MTVTREILRAYRGFGASMQRQIDSNPGEERLLVYLVMACFLYFIARVPELLKLSAAAATEEVSGMALFITNLVGSFFFAPLMFYALAALSRIVANLFGGQGNGAKSRLALFWALLLVAPLALISTTIQTAIPVEILAETLSLLMFLLFSFVWASTLSVAEGFKSPILTMSAIILTAFLLILGFRTVIMG